MLDGQDGAPPRDPGRDATASPAERAELSPEDRRGEAAPGPDPGAASHLGAIAARARAYAPALVASACLGALSVRAILKQAGHPALPLDDAFIHLQYARRLAEGGFFSYVAGAGYTTGATSVLWPALLAPFYLLGFRDLSLIHVVWALGVAFHAALAVETARLARPLVGRAVAVGAGAMCTAFGAFTWFAWSGMETVAFAWILLRTARLAADYCEPEPGARARTGALTLALHGLAAPLVRPEGAIASLLAAIALVAAEPHPPRARLGRLAALIPPIGPLLVPAVNRLLTGHATSSTTAVKWMIGNPNYSGRALWSAVVDNIDLLFSDVLDGKTWTAVFLPQGSSVVIYLGAVALAVVSVRSRRPVHAAFVGVIALGTLLPCTYLSFLWNRVRYIWPFAPAWFIMAACLAREIGDAAERVQRSLTYVAPLVTGIFAGALAAELPWTIRDLAQSAHAIDRQQVWLGRWAADHLPQDAVIGVNDTGAIAYLGGRKTFDVVGLTTEGEAPHWVAGAGSRFEHYERLPRERRPTHFIVYPHWMACPPVLGRELVDATVVDQSILGGTTMVAYEARWDTLGSGAAPMRAVPGERILDEIDVSDLVSEAAHEYEVGAYPGADQNNQAVLFEAPESGGPGDLDTSRAEIAEGGRMHRRLDRFMARLPGVTEARLVLRVASERGADLAIFVGGEEIGAVAVPAGAWVERAIALPSTRLSERTPIAVTLRRGAEFDAYHYWIVGR